MKDAEEHGERDDVSRLVRAFEIDHKTVQAMLLQTVCRGSVARDPTLSIRQFAR